MTSRVVVVVVVVWCTKYIRPLPTNRTIIAPHSNMQAQTPKSWGSRGGEQAIPFSHDDLGSHILRAINLNDITDV